MVNLTQKWGMAWRFASFLFLLLIGNALMAQPINEEWIKKNYTKREVMIRMRDGVRLFTAIYEPIQSDGPSPILMTRTPYKAAPYGEGKMNNRLWKCWKNYAKEKYILVIQDVRGRWKSEGEYMNVRPFHPKKKGKKDIDEASDVYDTAEWLIRNTANNNGKIGLIGSSYSGFYTLMGALSHHPAIRAAVPQAPVTDWFLGDDYHHNGALMLCDGFRFCSDMNRPRPVPTDRIAKAKPYYTTDEYSFFLKAGALKNLTRMLGDSIRYWNDLMEHPNYDAWWQARDARRGCYNIQPAVLVVGGTFDAEDCYGAWELYKAIRKQSPQTELHLTMGPWNHGAWNGSGDGNYLGNVRFGNQPWVPYYRNEIEFPFLQYHLKGIGQPTPSSQRIKVFFSGENRWETFAEWPAEKATSLSFYLNEGGVLSRQAPTQTHSCSEYVSDPAKPVPYTDKTQYSRAKEYMTDDQRFAERRPDVLCFKTEPLTEAIAVGGAIEVDLKVALSTTDADFIVKVIDEFPEDFVYDTQKDGKGNGSKYLMKGYQMLVRGEVMRGKFRNSFEHPEAFVPDQPTRVRFQMPDIAHTFRKGHRLVIQIQSTWFPLIDRNPQQFTNINTCDDDAFIPSRIRIFHQQQQASKITFKQLK